MLVLRDGRLVQSGPPRAVTDKPASVDVARLLGLYNLLPAEIRALDPGRNTSRISLFGAELGGPYFKGHLIGDRVTLCIRPDELRAASRDGSLRPNQVPMELLRAVAKPGGVRLEFSPDLAVEIPRNDYDPSIREWVVEFPAQSMRVI